MPQLPPIGPTQVTHGAWIGPMQANTAEVMEALLSQPRKCDRFDPSRLPPHLRWTLEQNLPKKGLKPFLLEHSDLFEVHESGGRQWHFSIKTSSRQPPPPTYTDSSAPTTGWSDQTGMPRSASSGPPPVTTAPASGWNGLRRESSDGSDGRGIMPMSSDGRGLMPGPPPPPSLPGPPGLTDGGWGLPPPAPPSVHDDYSTSWRGWDGWSGWEGGTTKEWSGSGGGWRGSAERDAPPAQHSGESWNDPRSFTTGTSSSHTELTAADMVKRGLQRQDALAG